MELEGRPTTLKVWLNGVYLGDHTGNITKCRLDVTDALRQGENLLAIRMLSPGSDEVFDGLTGQAVPARRRAAACAAGVHLAQADGYGSGRVCPARLRKRQAFH